MTGEETPSDVATEVPADVPTEVPAETPVATEPADATPVSA